MSDDQRQKFPPMAISDLLVLTLCVSFAMACIAPSLHDILVMPAEDLRISRWRLVAPEVTDYLAFGIALFGSIVLARERIRGSTRPLSPGQWIFVATGPFAALRVMSGAWHEVLAAYRFSETPVLFSALNDLLFGIVLCLSLAFSLRGLRGTEPRWRVCLFFVLAWLLAGCAWCALEVAQSRGLFRRELIVAWATAYVSAFLAACVAATIDVHKGIRRDWLHYLAIVLLALFSVSNVLHHGALLAKWWSDLYAHVIG